MLYYLLYIIYDIQYMIFNIILIKASKKYHNQYIIFGNYLMLVTITGSNALLRLQSFVLGKAAVL